MIDVAKLVSLLAIVKALLVQVPNELYFLVEKQNSPSSESSPSLCLVMQFMVSRGSL